MENAEVIRRIKAAAMGSIELDLSKQELTKIPSRVFELTHLTKLNLSDNQIATIPEEIFELDNLISIDFSINIITEIPEEVANLFNLTELDISDNQIVEIPEAIARLSNLTTLDFSENQIEEIPKAITKLSNLTELDLSRNKIEKIPDVIASLSSLTYLDFSENYIQEIPEEIANLSSLTHLDFSGNLIKKIPGVIANLSSLIYLDFSGNYIEEISEAIANLSSLIYLNFSGNLIKKIPEAIAKLSSLIYLIFSRNYIEKIPEVIANLSNLTHLDLSENCIEKIPEMIANLSNLTYLDLSGNYIDEIPEAVANLSKLKYLNMIENPLEDLYPEIIQNTDATQIINYLKQLQKGKRPLNEAKVLLVGQGAVGKTSLKKRLLYDDFDLNEPQTHDLSFEPWLIDLDGQEIRLNVWDFGGQEIQHTTHQFFLTKRSLYLLVCNCRISEEENWLEYWLKLIETFGDSSPVIIVGNKSDEQCLDIGRKALRDKYPNIKAILEISCKTNQGMEQLRQAIYSEIREMADVHKPLPKPWFAVKEALENLKAQQTDFITYNRYINICCQQEIPEEYNQEQLIELLHHIGLVLCFRDHPLLHSTNVLNPDWVTQAIYALLSDSSLQRQKKGIFDPADLSRILDRQRYPAQRHHYLIELMQEFELCFALSDDNPPCSRRYLIPGLLPKDQPDSIDLGENCLEFQYHYRVLPHSVLSRFIVRNHDCLDNHNYWRNGVILCYREGSEICNRACIRADFEDKKIFITLNGRQSTRRLFLGIIRNTFTPIHQSFGNLQVGEWVPVPGYPDHPPLDYQELLGLEAMGETEYPIGKLKIKVNLAQLLDGYEDRQSRQFPKYEFSNADTVIVIEKNSGKVTGKQ